MFQKRVRVSTQRRNIFICENFSMFVRSAQNEITPCAKRGNLGMVILNRPHDEYELVLLKELWETLCRALVRPLLLIEWHSPECYHLSILLRKDEIVFPPIRAVVLNKACELEA